jgi:hypothetical protein
VLKPTLKMTAAARALKVYQHQVSTMVVRVAHYALGSRRLSSEL